MESKIILGDCIEEMKKLKENSIDAIASIKLNRKFIGINGELK